MFLIHVHKLLLQALLDICANPLIRKTFHNCTFDLLVLDHHGFPVSGPVGDTMLQHHAAYPGLAHKLDQVAQQFFCTPPWKAEFRSSAKSLPELITYNGRDAQAVAVKCDTVNYSAEKIAIVRFRQWTETK